MMTATFVITPDTVPWGWTALALREALQDPLTALGIGCTISSVGPAGLQGCKRPELVAAVDDLLERVVSGAARDVVVLNGKVTALMDLMPAMDPALVDRAWRTGYQTPQQWLDRYLALHRDRHQREFCATFHCNPK